MISIQKVAENAASSNCILAADDNPSILRLITAVLEGEGFSVITAADGKSAYKILQSAIRNLSQTPR